MSTFSTEAALAECEHWNVFDANTYLGHSGVHGELALEAPQFLREMDRFAIKRALVSHFAGLEYDAIEGNQALERDMNPRLVPAWTVSSERASIDDIISRAAKAVRVWFGPLQHNFSSKPWCSGLLFEYLQQSRTLVLISRAEIEWDDLPRFSTTFLKSCTAARHWIPERPLSVSSAQKIFEFIFRQFYLCSPQATGMVPGAIRA